MKKMILAAFAALGVTIGIASLANAAAALVNATPSGPYDNTANSLRGWYVGGGDVG